jgi:hypothetical protein
MWRCAYICASGPNPAEFFMTKHHVDAALGLASHIVVSTYAGPQTIPDKQLAAVGAKRISGIRVPHFGVALQRLPGAELMLTITSGVRSVVEGNRELRVVKAPQELHAFHFLMAWHPRLNTDPHHLWLREAVNSSGSQWLSQRHLMIRAGPQSASRVVAQQFLPIFCGAGSAHLPEHSCKVLLGFEAACHGNIQDTRVGVTQHRLRALYPMA